ncbi:hypothetical protein IJT17_00170 [bacterium]|nr:hypothetical protein [bacterium]
MQNMSASPNSVASAMLSQALTIAGLSMVAWAGPHGAEHYRMTSDCDESLAKLSSWARQPNELLHLAVGWWRALYAEDKASASSSPLTIIVEDFPPKLWESLGQLQRQGLSVIVVLLDEQHRYVAETETEYCGLAGYGKAQGIYCAEPASCARLSSINSSLQQCLARSGVRVVHLLGSSANANRQEPFSPSFGWEYFPPSPYSQHTEDFPSLAAAALTRMMPEVLNSQRIVALWTRSLHPGPLTKLGPRLQYCSINGLIWQIASLVKRDYHPIVFLSAASIPVLLPDLMGLEGCQVTFVILDGCCTLYASNERRQPLAMLHDLGLLSSVPDMLIGEPADEEEARSMMAAMLNSPGLSALRLSSAPAINMPPAPTPKELAIGQGRRLRSGKDISFVCLGTTAHVALLTSETLRSWGVQAGVYDMRFLSPLDPELLSQAAASGRIITVENHSIDGGLGTLALEAVSRWGLGTHLQKAAKVGLDCDYMECAPEDHCISINGLLQAAKKILDIN